MILNDEDALKHFNQSFLNISISILVYNCVRVRRYRLHYTKHYIINLSDNRTQRDDRLWFHSDRLWFHSDKCHEKFASVSTYCNIYRSHASVENLGSLHDSVTSPVGSV